MAMDAAKRKEIAAAWKSRRPNMGVFAVTCTETGDAFLGVLDPISCLSPTMFRRGSSSLAGQSTLTKVFCITLELVFLCMSVQIGMARTQPGTRQVRRLVVLYKCAQ